MTGTATRNHPPLMTVDEFIKWPGDGTGTRYELVNGELRAQDPASDAHGTIHPISGSCRSCLIAKVALLQWDDPRQAQAIASPEG